MLIKSYGLFWNPNIVDWGRKGSGNSGKLIGEVKFQNGKKEIDFWNAKGIYVLHNNFKTMYIGKSSSNGIGKRVRYHLTDRLAGKWDMFSWYSVSSPRQKDKKVAEPGKRVIAPNNYINTFEALAILIFDPPLNQRREYFDNAFEVTQKSHQNPKSIRRYLEEILKTIKDSK